jgi:predicted nucleic acid-binding protein
MVLINISLFYIIGLNMKIYLETSVFNYYFDIDRKGHTETVQLFKAISDGRFLPYTSPYVVTELEATPNEKREKMLNLITQFNINIVTDNPDTVNFFADFYIKNKIIPPKFIMDARHIAIAMLNNLDMIVSFNFKHIVRTKTKVFTDTISKIKGFSPIIISSPVEVMKNEKI